MQSRWMWIVLVLGICLSAQAAMLPDAPAGGAGDIVATAKWETEGADIDLKMAGPSGEEYRPEKDFLSGPATERIVVRDAAGGQYRVGVIWMNDREGVTVPVTVEVKQGEKVLTSFQANLTKLPADRKIVEFTAVGGPAGPDLVTTMKWETQGADVDLLVIGPNGQSFRPAQDIMSGPAAEVCTVKSARAGDYKARVVLVNGKAGVQVPVTVEAKLGDNVVGTFQVTLDADNNSRVFTGIKVGQ